MYLCFVALRLFTASLDSRIRASMTGFIAGLHCTLTPQKATHELAMNMILVILQFFQCSGDGSDGISNLAHQILHLWWRARELNVV